MAHLGKRPKLNSFPTSQKIAIKIIEPQFPESEIWKSGKTSKAVMSYDCIKCPPEALWPGRPMSHVESMFAAIWQCDLV